MKRGIAVFGLISLFLSFLAFSTFGAIGVSTLGIWVKLPAGESIEGTLRFVNFHGKEIHLIVKLCDWKRMEEGESILLQPNSIPRSLVPYIQLKPQETILKPGETKKFSYEITMPKDARGSLWGAILAVPKDKLEEYRNLTNREENEFSINELALYGFTVKIWALEASSASASGEINSIEVIKPEGKEEFRLTFLNTGNVPLRPEGELNILDGNGEVVTSSKIDKFGVLPGSKRILKLPITNTSLPKGNLRAEAILKFGKGETSREVVSFIVR